MAIAIVLILLVVGSVLFHFWSPWWITPLASNWSEMDDTLMITFVVTGVVFVAVNFFMAYAIYRFRYQEDRRAAYEPENKRLEWWLTGLTTIGVVVMLAPGLLVYGDFVHVHDDASVIEVMGKQWQWGYRFPGEDGVLGNSETQLISLDNPFGLDPNDPNAQDDVLVKSGELHIPINQPVQILLRSNDVLHDYYVPHFRAKMDAVPGLITSFWFTPTRLGRFDAACAEYCGIGHHTMHSMVVVDAKETYDTWLDEQPTFAESYASASVVSDDPLVQKGKAVAEEAGCMGCHSIDGSPGAGPTWKGLFGKQESMVDGSTVTVDKEYLIEAIVDPNAKVVEGFSPIMPAGSFSDEELEAVIAYTISLSKEDKDAGAGGEAEDESNGDQAGKQVAESQGCFGCHSIDGTQSVGPTWKGLLGKTETLTDGSQVEVDEAYFKESIVDPNASVIEGYSPMMPAYELTEEQLDALVEFAKSISD